MAKRKHSKKSHTNRQNDNRVSVRTRNQKRNLILTSALGALIIAIIAFLVLGSDSSSSPSAQLSPVVTPESNTRTEQASAPASGKSGPSLNIQEPSHDFGLISQENKVSHTFVVQNTGDEPLRLIRAKGS